MKIRIIVITFFILTFAVSQSFAQVRKYSNEFLSIGVGARALAMSNSVIASTGDVSGGYWNPAVLNQMKPEFQLAAMHASYFAGIAAYNYGSIAKKIDSVSALGVSYIRFGVDNIPNTIELIDNEGRINYDRITSFSVADQAFIFSYSRKIKKLPLHTGASIKVIHRKAGDMAQAWGFGLDAGALFKHKSWLFAAVLRDATTTVNMWTFTLNDRTKEVFTLTGNDIPENGTEITLPKLLTGAGKRFLIKESLGILPELGVDFTFDGKRNTLLASKLVSIDPHLGLELDFKQKVFLRFGVGNIQQSPNVFGNRTLYSFQPNFGIGLVLNALHIEYALTDIGDQSIAPYSNIFSLKLDLNRKNDK